MQTVIKKLKPINLTKNRGLLLSLVLHPIFIIYFVGMSSSIPSSVSPVSMSVVFSEFAIMLSLWFCVLFVLSLFLCLSDKTDSPKKSNSLTKLNRLVFFHLYTLMPYVCFLWAAQYSMTMQSVDYETTASMIAPALTNITNTLVVLAYAVFSFSIPILRPWEEREHSGEET